MPDNTEIPQKKYRIGFVSGLFLIAAAVSIDLLQFGIDFLGGVGAATVVGIAFTALAAVSSPALTALAALTFWLWFRLLGIKFGNPKRALMFGGTALSELIPFLNALPAWTALVVGTVIMTVLEDRKHKPVQKNEEAGYNEKQ